MTTGSGRADALVGARPPGRALRTPTPGYGLPAKQAIDEAHDAIKEMTAGCGRADALVGARTPTPGYGLPAKQAIDEAHYAI